MLNCRNHSPLNLKASLGGQGQRQGDGRVVCYTAVFSVAMQRSLPQTAAENRTTFLSLCVCGLTYKPIMYNSLDNT